MGGLRDQSEVGHQSDIIINFKKNSNQINKNNKKKYNIILYRFLFIYLQYLLKTFKIIKIFNDKFY